MIPVLNVSMAIIADRGRGPRRSGKAQIVSFVWCVNEVHDETWAVQSIIGRAEDMLYKGPN